MSIEQQERAVAVLEQGGVVLMPCDTILGLSCRADCAAAVARINRMKMRPEHKGYIVLAGSADMVQRFADMDVLSEEAQFAMKQLWPGPVTGVVPVREDSPCAPCLHEGHIAFRVPDVPELCHVVERVGCPIVSTSVNTSGSAFATSRAEVDPSLLEHVDLVVDAAPRGSTPSAVLHVGSVPFQLLRRGPMRVRDMERITGVRILDVDTYGAMQEQERALLLFVCTGNTCRSPLAAGIMRAVLRSWGLDDRYECASAGVSAILGAGASPKAITSAKKIGVDLSGHSSTELDGTLIARASAILCMEHSHMTYIQLHYPHAMKKAYLLKQFDPDDATRDIRDIHDPAGRTHNQYRRIRDEIQVCCESLCGRLLEGGQLGTSYGHRE